MVRVEGPAVEVLNLVFLRDWELETEVGIEELVEAGDLRPAEPAGDDIVQIVPSTPGVAGGLVIHELLLKVFYSAKRELIITTPYFVPTDTVVHRFDNGGSQRRRCHPGRARARRFVPGAPRKRVHLRTLARGRRARRAVPRRTAAL